MARGLSLRVPPRVLLVPCGPQHCPPPGPGSSPVPGRVRSAGRCVGHGLAGSLPAGSGRGLGAGIHPSAAHLHGSRAVIPELAAAGEASRKPAAGSSTVTLIVPPAAGGRPAVETLA